MAAGFPKTQSPDAPGRHAIDGAPTMEIDVSKKNMRGNREPRKPKQAKAKPNVANSIEDVMKRPAATAG